MNKSLNKSICDTHSICVRVCRQSWKRSVQHARIVRISEFFSPARLVAFPNARAQHTGRRSRPPCIHDRHVLGREVCLAKPLTPLLPALCHLMVCAGKHRGRSHVETTRTWRFASCMSRGTESSSVELSLKICVLIFCSFFQSAHELIRRSL